MRQSQPRTIAFIGKSGSGKDTQAKLLAERLTPSLSVSTGDLGRALAKTPSVFGRKVKKLLAEGGLFPDWLAEYLWKSDLIKRLHDDEHIILPSSPRHLREAEELDIVCAWLERPLPEVVLITVSDEEATNRLLQRKRGDDTNETIARRLSWFDDEVGPVIDYYKTQGRIHTIDGVGSVEEVYARVREALEIS